MEIQYYGFNTFLIRSRNYKIVFDPGCEFYHFRFNSILPQSEWSNLTHIFVTHGDPDHHWYTDKVARESGAPVISNRTMFIEEDGKKLMIESRKKDLPFTMPLLNIEGISPEESREINGILVKGIKTTHGPITFRLGPFKKKFTPGPEERVGWGAIGFKLEFENKTFINLGDTLLEKEKWKNLHNPDVLMIPIGGKKIHNTMNEEEAVEAIEMIEPKMVIPCHYNCPSFIKKNGNPADVEYFKDQVERLGIFCSVLGPGESINI